MREALIILPNEDNHGRHIVAVHDRLQVALCNVFGGYTATQACGGWQSTDGARIEESVTCYMVAMEDSQANAAVLREIALDAGKEAKQEAMYVRYASGEVEIIPTK